MAKDKGGFLAPKAIGNRIKAKGLQKLRWCAPAPSSWRHLRDA